MSYFGRLTGRHYESVEEMRHYESREAMRRSALSAEESEFDNLPADKVRELLEKVSRSEHTKAAQLQAMTDVQVFMQLHPEYKVSRSNSNAMMLALSALGADIANEVATLQQMEAAFEHCKLTGTVELNEAALRRQEAQRIQTQAEHIRTQREARANFNEAEAYDMPLDELRQLASDQLSGIQRVPGRDGIGSMGSEYGETTRPLNGAVPDPLADPERIATPGSSLNNRGFRGTDISQRI